jgi:3-oxoacyl-(acyl-carrier-protein) synthase
LASKVYVAGLGIISAIGNSVADTMHAFENAESGIHTRSILLDTTLDLPVGEVSFTNEELQNHLGIEKKIPRTALLGIFAARRSVIDAGIKNTVRWKTGLISGTTVGGMNRTEIFYPDFLKDKSKGRLRDVVYHECGSVTELIADDLGIKDFISTINTACSSSVNSIILGARLISYGQLDIVIAGGTDALTRFTLNGFNSLMILDKAPCRPFDAGRAGLNLGEGAGYMVLVSERVLKEDDLNPLSFIHGYANSNDAYHQTASSPEGRGSFIAMQHAIDRSGLSLKDIDYINLHGTGTINNDSSEGNAIKRLFGELVPRSSSTKAFTGHTLGASGGIEAVFSVLAIRHGCIFPNLRFQNPIPETGIVPQLVFEKSLSVNHVLSNSFGFGGNCSSIIFSKAS